MLPTEFVEAFSATKEGGIKVRTKSGATYWVHDDQLPAILDNGLIYGYNLIKNHRRKTDVKWFWPKNVTQVKEEIVP